MDSHEEEEPEGKTMIDYVDIQVTPQEDEAFEALLKPQPVWCPECGYAHPKPNYTMDIMDGQDE
jgi:hypothetical protein